MIWSGWDGDLGLELYLADRNADPSQYESSQRALELLQSLRAVDRVKIETLHDLTPRVDEFKIVAHPGSKITLPFLISTFGCETGAVEGHSGLDEVTLAITSLVAIKPQTRPNQQY